MKFINIGNCAIVAWGMKEGKNVFFSDNLENDDNFVNTKLLDIRPYFGFTRSNVGIVFYSLSYDADYVNFTIYRTINDWFGREGYYAISILIPVHSSTEGSKVFTSLQALSGLYLEKYIDTNHKPNQIRKDVKEDKGLFIDLLEKTENKIELIPCSNPAINSGNQNVYIKYSDDSDLLFIFKNYHCKFLSQYQQIFIVPENYPELNIQRLDEIPFKKLFDFIEKNEKLPDNLSLIIRIVDDEKNTLLFPDSITYYINDVRKNNFTKYNEFVIENLSLNDKIRITVSKEGYSQPDINKYVHSFFASGSGKGICTIPLKKNVIVNPDTPKQKNGAPNIYEREVKKNDKKESNIQNRSFLKRYWKYIISFILLGVIALLIIILIPPKHIDYSKTKNYFNKESSIIFDTTWTWNTEKYIAFWDSLTLNKDLLNDAYKDSVPGFYDTSILKMKNLLKKKLANDSLTIFNGNINDSAFTKEYDAITKDTFLMKLLITKVYDDAYCNNYITSVKDVKNKKEKEKEKNELINKIREFLTGIDFNTKQANIYLDSLKLLDTDHNNKSLLASLENFEKVCVNVNRMNNYISGSSSSTKNEIDKEYNLLIGYLNTDQYTTIDKIHTKFLRKN